MEMKYKMFDFAKIVKTINYWSWKELIWGQRNRIIRNKDIIEYAKNVLEEDIKRFDEVLELSIADEDEDIASLLVQLANLDKVETDEAIQEKWRYAILLDLYNNQDSYDNVYENIENIYADFDYQEDMASFIGYMPSSSGRSIEESWKMYLNDKSEQFVQSRE
jgi:Uncharacterized protein conserved in bacteria